MMRMLMATAVSRMLVLGMLAGLALGGCGDGYDNDEAVAACDGIKQADAKNCMSDADFDACVVCHEDCGDLCSVIDTACPPAFSCNE